MLDRLAAIYRHARPEAIAELGPWITKTMDRYAISTPLRQCHFLAQLGHESGELNYREEIASGRAYEGRRDLGNTRKGDGTRFKGRGGFCLTGRANYAAYDNYRQAGGSILNEPWRVSQDPELFADVSGWFWDTRKLNGLADQDDFRGITRLINGGFNGLADRRRLLVIAKSVLIPSATTHSDQKRSIFALQRNLVALGYDLAVDGVAGPQTKSAVKRFQANFALATDGIAGANTWAEIDRAIGRKADG